MPSLEIAGQDVPRPLRLRHPVVIIERLIARLLEVQPGGLLLNDQGSGPKQVDEALPVPRQVPNPVLISRHLPPADPKAVEEFVVKGLGLTLLVTSALVRLGELCRPRADFGPLKAHYPQLRQAARQRQSRNVRATVRMLAEDA